MTLGAEEPSSDEKRKLFQTMHVPAPGGGDSIPFKIQKSKAAWSSNRGENQLY